MCTGVFSADLTAFTELDWFFLAGVKGLVTVILALILSGVGLMIAACWFPGRLLGGAGLGCVRVGQ
jgi:hypothetical protein